ncbi:MAG: tyrosine-type recombinase/integrase [Candidatus Hydrogenedentota bacterium]|nr:MAG: tyrosine-type recombinase/integrase [Candidatus Hydrogenedentota bacterium]
MNELVEQTDGGLRVLIALATNGKAENTRKAYGRAITDYAEWVADMPIADKVRVGGFTRSSLLMYVRFLQDAGMSATSINQRLAALRSLAKELKYQGTIDEKVANGIADVENVPDRGRHVGHWLTQDEARNLLDTPDSETLKGRQERVMLALLLGVGLRRSEAADLTWEHIQETGGHHFVKNIVGKHGRRRTVPIPPWAVSLLLNWQDETEDTGPVLRAVNKGGKLAGPVKTKNNGMTDGGMSSQAVYKQVRLLAARAGIEDLAPHSLRKTYALRLYKQGCPLDQISLFLGHQDLATTEIYLGLKDVDMDDPFMVEY